MINRVDPKNISNTLKEAVAESMLGNIYQRVSGEGCYGECVIDNRPSSKFVSGFLEPAYIASNGSRVSDDTTNPIHIITAGLDFQALKSAESEFFATPRFSIYVRVLPTTEEFKKYKAHLELTAEVKQIIKTERQKILKNYKEQKEDLLKNDKESFYKKRQEELDKITSKVLVEQFHINFYDQRCEESPFHINEEELIASSSLNEGESLDVPLNEIPLDEISEDTAFQDMQFIAYPGMNFNIPDGVMDHVRPLQKWIRLNIDKLPSITVPVTIGEIELEEFVIEHSKALQSAISARIEEWLRDANPLTGGKLWAFPRELSLTPNQIKHWDETLKQIRIDFHNREDSSLFSLPSIDIRWVIEIIDQHDDPSVKTIRVALENRTTTEKSNRTEIEESVFQMSLSVSIQRKFHIDLKLDRIKPSYRYNEFLTYSAMGFNNGVSSTEIDEMRLLKTTWMPIYAQPRIRPEQYKDIDVSFAFLQTDEGARALCSLPKAFKEWIDKTEKLIDPCSGVIDDSQKKAERCQFEEDKLAWRRECDKVAKGIEFLISSADAYKQNASCRRGIPFRAWCLMQETMGRVAEKKGFKSWHLFQVAFILANLMGLISRMSEFSDQAHYDEEWDEAVSLLYFSTGGGKTEAFFGLLIFNLFFDRLRGKTIGVTAMLRYPLRLLTTQQAQRLAITLAMAERVRWKYEIEGRAFEIGFWVGSNNTPNSRNKCTDIQVPLYKGDQELKEEELLKKAEYLFAKEAWNKLPFCPFCHGGTVLRKYQKYNDLIGHACVEEDCDWNIHHNGAKKVPLPFYIVDEDIYEIAPSVVLGTIDKLALIGQSPSTIRRFFGMLGFSPYFNESTQMLVTPKSPADINRYCTVDSLTKLQPFYENGRTLFHDPFPSLIIQDEAHLLEESLGTFSGIFQTTFEQILKELGGHPRMRNIVAMVPGTSSPRMPKIVAASATVTEPEKQMEAIYQRNAFQFPWPGPKLYRNFYAAPQEPKGDDAEKRGSLNFDEERSHRARFYASLMTNGKPHTSTTVEILGNFHVLITQLMILLCDKNSSKRQNGRDYLIKGVLDTRLKYIYEEAIQKSKDEELATLVDLHRISLTYVTNKKGGDQIMAAESDTTLRIHEDNDIKGFGGLNSELISGAVSASEIEAVIKKSEDRPLIGEPLSEILSENLIRSVVATSAISHGVDVNEFNTMIFAGVPSNVSEYIQASSRVGRTHVGISILVPTPQRRRDRYILEINDVYHRFLERLIRPAAVNRWVENALVRSLPSIFQAYIIAVRELLLLIDTDDAQKSSVGDYEKIDKIDSLIHKMGVVNFNMQLESFIHNAVGLTHSEYAPLATEQFKTILRHEVVKNIVEDLDPERYTSLRDFFKAVDNRDKDKKRLPMTSLRDIDPSGKISFEKKGNKSIDTSRAYDVIRLINQRGKNEG